MPRDRPTFLTLPVELRQEIYTHLLVLPPPPPPETQQPIYRCSHPYSPAVDYKKRPTLHPQILAVSPQTNLEAAPVLYGRNTFALKTALTPHLAAGGIPTTITVAAVLHHPFFPAPKPITNRSLLGLIKKWHLRICIGFPPPSCPRRSQTAAAALTTFTPFLSNTHDLTLEVYGATPNGNGGAGVGVGIEAAALRPLEAVSGVRRVRICGMVGRLEGYLAWLKARMATMGDEVGGEEGVRGGGEEGG